MKWVEEKGRIILNGNKVRDKEGHWTYEKEIKSVIDSGIVNMRAWAKVCRVEVGYRVESDHLPICVWIEGKEKGRDEREKSDEKEVQLWGKMEIDRYIEKEKKMIWGKWKEEKGHKLKKKVEEIVVKMKVKTGTKRRELENKQ